MALRTFVKVSGVNNLSDARYCAGMGVDLIGFDIDPTSINKISPDKFKEITEWISGVAFVGEIKTGNLSVLQEYLQSFNINFLQFEDAAKTKEFKLLEIPLILKLRSEDTVENIESVMSNTSDDVEFFIVESESDNFDKELLNRISALAKKYNIVLGYGITENNVNEIIDTTDIKGISLRGGEEIRPGYKDFDDLAKVLELIEVDDIDL
jgi:phosphoribosylanthranilate isomerase